MKKKISGQITVEAAIVIPMVIMIIASLMYFSFYVHDVVKIKGFVYSMGNRNIEKGEKEFDETVREDLKNAALFLLTPDIECMNKIGKYQIQIVLRNNKSINWLERLLKIDDSIQMIEVEKDMNYEILYMGRAIGDGLKNNEEN